MKDLVTGWIAALVFIGVAFLLVRNNQLVTRLGTFVVDSITAVAALGNAPKG